MEGTECLCSPSALADNQSPLTQLYFFPTQQTPCVVTLQPLLPEEHRPPECSHVPRGSDHLVERQALKVQSVITTLESGEAPGAGSPCFSLCTSNLLSWVLEVRAPEQHSGVSAVTTLGQAP